MGRKLKYWGWGYEGTSLNPGEIKNLLKSTRGFVGLEPPREGENPISNARPGAGAPEKGETPDGSLPGLEVNGPRG